MDKLKKNIIYIVLLNLSSICFSCSKMGWQNFKSMFASKNLLNELIDTFDEKENDKSNIFLSGDIIIMRDTSNNLTHTSIYYKVDDHNDNIGAILPGVSASNTTSHLKNNKYIATTYRYNPKNMDLIEINNIRESIGNQAFLWYNKATSYNYEVLFYHLFSKHGKKMDYENYDEIKKDFDQLIINLLKDNNFEYFSTLLFIKYALRSNVIASLNKGFTCSGFVISCIGSAFLKDLLSPYYIKDDDNFWPSLKYGGKDEKSKASAEYMGAVKLLKQDKILTYNKEKLIKGLNLEYNLLPEKARNLIKNKDLKIKKEKISISYYLLNKGGDEKEIVNDAMKLLGDLRFLNPKISTIEDLVQYFDKNPDIWLKKPGNLF